NISRIGLKTGYYNHSTCSIDCLHRVICCHAEAQNLATVILLASLNDRHVHICHVSRKDEIELIRAAKAKGIKVTCEVTPHHLFLTDNDIAKLGENRSQVRPKLATAADREALWKKYVSFW